jgi:putative ABC transport system permease protein
MIQAFRLSLAELRHDWALSLCQVFALAAVLTPLLVLAGLHEGVLGQLMDQLRRNPAMREITPLVTGTNRFTQTWITTTRARPDVTFIVGDARFIAAGVEATPVTDPTHASAVLTLIPTGATDPLRPPGAVWPDDAVLPRGTVTLDGAVTPDGAATPNGAVAPGGEAEGGALTWQASADLGVKAGDWISVMIPRRNNGVDQSQQQQIRVTAVLPLNILPGRRAMLVDAGFVLAVQQFRDGYAIPAFGWPGEPLPSAEPHFERFRMYARSIDDVEALTGWLRDQGIEPVSRVADIAPVRALDHGLVVVLLVIAGFAASGLAIAITAMQVSAVQRKRRELALLALIGYPRGFMIGIALLEALILTLGGMAVSTALFRGAAAAIDAVFAQLQRLTGPACTLGAQPLALILGATLILALAPSALTSWRIARIEPAGVLRET